MPALCLPSNDAYDLRCPVCGQGFLLFAEHVSATVGQQLRRTASLVMRGHHTGARSVLHAHPADAFEVGAQDTALGHVLRSAPPAELAKAVC